MARCSRLRIACFGLIVLAVALLGGCHGYYRSGGFSFSGVYTGGYGHHSYGHYGYSGHHYGGHHYGGH